MNRTEFMRARCTRRERVALLALARDEDRSPSELLRELVRRAAVERGLWPPPETDRLAHQAKPEPE